MSEPPDRLVRDILIYTFYKAEMAKTEDRCTPPCSEERLLVAFAVIEAEEWLFANKQEVYGTPKFEEELDNAFVRALTEEEWSKRVVERAYAYDKTKEMRELVEKMCLQNTLRGI